MNQIKYMLVFLSISCCAQGQIPKQTNLPIDTINGQSDTVFLYKSEYELYKKLQLPLLTNTTHQYYFRYWSNGRTIDIWTDDYKNFYGFTISYLFKVDKTEGGNYKIQKMFTTKTTLDAGLAKSVYDTIKKYSVFSFNQTQRVWIRGGNSGFVCSIEQTSSKVYGFKTYYNPNDTTNNWANPNVQNFLYSIEDFIEQKIKEKKELFPSGCYSDGNLKVIMVYDLKQEKQQDKYEK